MSFDRHTYRMSPHHGWYSRGYLPRYGGDNVIQSITYRLIDAVPAEKVEEWKRELEITQAMPASDVRRIELSRRICKYEDLGRGECLLKIPDIAEIVQGNLLHFDGKTYHLIAWCVMPNHVHVLFEPFQKRMLGKITHSWKSYTAKKINKLMGRQGEVWEREGYDRFIRDDNHFNNVLSYIEKNPEKAGLVRSSSDWKYSSAWSGCNE